MDEIAMEKAKAMMAKEEFEKAQRKKPKYPAVSGAPHVKSGPISGEGRPFSLSRAISAMKGHRTEEGKDDLHTLQLFRKSLETAAPLLANISSSPDTILLPLCTSFLPDGATDTREYREYKSRMVNDVRNYDPDEAAYYVRKSGFATVRKDQSYLDSTLGGTLVPPPVQGDLIELIRPQEAMMAAGATTVALPPNGKISYPRITAAPTAYWVGENKAITDSEAETGQVSLTAKKVADLVRMPNELLKFSNPAADAAIQQEMARSLTLAFDSACFYGPGTAIVPKGLVNYDDTDQLVDYATSVPEPLGVDINGNVLRPEDGYRMAGIIEDRFNVFIDGFGWIARPSLVNGVLGYRSDSGFASGDAEGPFVQSMMRLFGDKVFNGEWCGYKVTKSSVIRNTYTKGSGTGLTEVFGGIWKFWLIGMYGAVEVATSVHEGSSFQNDQTALRVIMHCDAAPRHEGAFIRYSQLLTNRPAV